MTWKVIKFGDLFEQYRIEHIVQDNRDYGQITISKNGYIKFRTTKNGKSIGRKRQFIIDLVKYPNTLLFTRQGVAEGAIAFAPQEVNGCIATENMPMFSLKDGVDKKFVELLLKSEQYKNAVKKLIPTGSAQKSIHERDLMQIVLTVPSEEEQKKLSYLIDKRLKSIDTLNNEVQTQQTLLKKLRQAILQEAIEGKLTASWREQNPDVESASVLLEKIKYKKEQLIKEKKIKKQKPLPPINENKIPFKIPDSWEWCRLRDVIIDIRGGGTPSKNNPNYWNGTIPWASVKDLKGEHLQKTKDFITYEGLKNSSSNLIEKNNIIISTRMGLGKIVFNDIDVAINQDLKALYIEMIDKKYFFYTYKTYTINGRGTTVGGIRQEVLLEFLFPLPPLQEQKEIVRKIENLFAICDELQTQIEASKKSSQTLMQAVLKEVFKK